MIAAWIIAFFLFTPKAGTDQYPFLDPPPFLFQSAFASIQQPSPLALSDADAYIVQPSYYIPAPPKPHKPPASVLCSCVDTAKWLVYGSLGGISWGNADKIEPVPGLEPAPGLIGITNEGPIDGHLFYVASTSADFVHTKEGNWSSCQFTERELRKDDPRIKGYWQPPPPVL